ncbi:translocating chain-associated membrane protein 1-like isoform X2 [Tubulanus polymorphus]|uniref:translocating chain-associated membrane protein 1-like isoform X2 n=1 Tax=Tubulanus polymorphus TaxID=672921 RepID=UPI003DA46969
MPGLRRQGKSTKNPSFMSHEFIIQNHADAVSCVMMVFVIGLMFQATAPYASVFVAMQHQQNTTMEDGASVMSNMYSYGWKDIFTTVFYFMLCIVVHAVLQEYVLDKLNRRMHLSKIKHSKFNESGQLMVFYLTSVIWGTSIIMSEDYISSISDLWHGYPEMHGKLPFMVKFFFIIQMSYWLHGFPELYFMKIKRDEMPPRIQYTTLYLIFITAAYLLNFNRLAICILVLHYAVEFIFHAARLLYFADKTEIANTGFMVWNVLFVLVRLVSITLAVLTFWFGLPKTSQTGIIFKDGNFNTAFIRINCLVACCLIQAFMMWRYITFHLKRLRERTAAAATTSSKSKIITTPSKKSNKDKKNKRTKEDDISLLPEADQNTLSDSGLRARSKRK